MTDTQGASAATTSTGTDAAADAAAAAAAAATGSTDAQRAPSPADLANRPAPSAPSSAENGGGVDTSGWPEAARAAYAAERERANGLQQEAMKSRVNAKAAAAEAAQRDTLSKIARALGFEAEGDDAAPTIESVTAELTSTRTAAEAAQKEAALLRAAVEARVEPSRLDYFQFLADRDADYRGASPTADGFADTLSATVAKLIAADPTLVRAVPAAKSGADAYGGASGSEITQDAFDAMSTAERSKLYTSDRATYDRLAEAAYQRAKS